MRTDHRARLQRYKAIKDLAIVAKCGSVGEFEFFPCIEDENPRVTQARIRSQIAQHKETGAFRWNIRQANDGVVVRLAGKWPGVLN